MKAIRRRQWEIQCGNGEQTADSWMWTGFTKSCPDLEDYSWDYSGHQMGEEIQQRGGLRWGARGHIERTGMCNDNNRSLLPGLSVLEWNCCVCVSLRWAVHYFFRFFMCHLSVVISNLVRDSDSPQSSRTWIAACHKLWPPHTRRPPSQEPTAATRGSEPEERMAFKRLGLLNILCKNHVWLWNVLYTVLLLFLKRMFMLMRRTNLLPKCHNTCALKKAKTNDELLKMLWFLYVILNRVPC